MYYPNDIEECCYDQAHIEWVTAEIRSNFHSYFSNFLETNSGHVISSEVAAQLAQNLGATVAIKKRSQMDVAKRLKTILAEGIKDFERDRQSYLDIMDEESLEEHSDDPSYFKNKVLRDRCPIIHSTLHAKTVKELDKYRAEFSRADANELLDVITNLNEFARRYMDDVYDPDTYDSVSGLDELAVSELLEDEFIVYGVIGGGIKSHFLYKLFPQAFPNRSREAVWALWYLSGKKTFGCTQDSEFLMIDTKNIITQQNFFYPYDLFVYYSFQIYLLLKTEANKIGCYINPEYKYVMVDSFLSFVARCHSEETAILKSNIREDGHGY
ncbi:hypothetical protein [Alicyclobacillus sp. ALC3]|uniref:hypothetical protein n=1 Tax=Alicyclobacillus sp. ALC3 TaxID=2796143 RepID=UPI0023799476|nr:hypothetical protein [Alicyclobacillus sp. ALC3]WDL98477.1 hypothetical protein JC200_07285 [Alicyclobacillus sp. ALC3]